MRNMSHFSQIVKHHLKQLQIAQYFLLSPQALYTLTSSSLCHTQDSDRSYYWNKLAVPQASAIKTTVFIFSTKTEVFTHITHINYLNSAQLKFIPHIKESLSFFYFPNTSVFHHHLTRLIIRHITDRCNKISAQTSLT